MKSRTITLVRCAIYTRVSTDQGLEQDFNSLDAQYEASEAFIRSQAHAGWKLIRSKYDDGGFSGGNTERPALQRLLDDLRAGKIDVIVVYKVDRLTRSLADFAKLVELFDGHNVSFVSVTQQFNTTTSMGRLTLNVLLSFAQFEREVTSERIRDKIAASKRKGLWVGGMAPLGYDTKDRKITVNKAEAETVRTIFRSYLKLGSLNLLMPELRKRGIISKRRTLRSGKATGGIPFTSGPLAHILRNRFYIGEVVFKGETLPGEQLPLLDRDLFDAVQSKLDASLVNHKAAKSKSAALLLGRIFDDRGNRMTPSHARKRGIKYRYYVSSKLVQALPEQAGSVGRVPADEIEALVAKSARAHIGKSEDKNNASVVRDHVVRVEIQPDRLIIELSAKADTAKKGRQKRKRIEVPWRKTLATRRREILIPIDSASQPVRPIRSEARLILISAIARARRWLNEMISNPTTSVEGIARRERCSVRKINMTISLAFLAPDLIKAAVEGRLPLGYHQALRPAARMGRSIPNPWAHGAITTLLEPVSGRMVSSCRETGFQGGRQSGQTPAVRLPPSLQRPKVD
jgi:site-specific DNA recombinase